MLKLIEPSRSCVGRPYTTTSATICFGMANSESVRSLVIRLKISSAVGPGIRKCISWRSPLKADGGPVGGLVPVKRSPVRASAGPGAIPSDEAGKAYFAFDEGWLKGLTASPSARLSIIRVEGGFDGADPECR